MRSRQAEALAALRIDPAKSRASRKKACHITRVASLTIVFVCGELSRKSMLSGISFVRRRYRRKTHAKEMRTADEELLCTSSRRLE